MVQKKTMSHFNIFVTVKCRKGKKPVADLMTIKTLSTLMLYLTCTALQGGSFIYQI